MFYKKLINEIFFQWTRRRWLREIDKERVLRYKYFRKYNHSSKVIAILTEKYYELYGDQI